MNATATIRYIKDKDDNIVLPVTHERGVIDSNGVTLETKITRKEDASNKVTVIQTDSTDTQYPSARAVRGLVVGALEEGDSDTLLELYYPLDTLTNDY